MYMTLQVWCPDRPEDEVLVMVCRTGMNTTMGGMIRELIAPSTVHKEKDPFLPVRLKAHIHLHVTYKHIQIFIIHVNIYIYICF